MRPAAYDPIARVVDMDRAGILASFCFPSFPRFCGQIFWEAKDKDLALLVRAGVQRLDDRRVVRRRAGSLHPAGHHPAVGPGRRGGGDRALRGEGCDRVRVLREPRAARPADHPRPRPLLGPGDGRRAGHADRRVHARRVVVDDAGDLDRRARRSPTSPSARSAPPGTMLAWLFSDYFERMPGLKIALSEGNIGWMPYFIERAEQVIDKQRHWAQERRHRVLQQRGRDPAGDGRPRPPRRAATIRDHIFGCFIEEIVRSALASTSSARTT